MRKDQLSEAVGRVDETLIAEAMCFEGMAHRRKWSRGALVAACVTALLTVTVAAAGLAGGWKLWTEPVDRNDPLQQEFVDSDAVLMGRSEAGAYPLSQEVLSRIEAQAEQAENREFATVRDVENEYGIRLLRMDPDRFSEERFVHAHAGVYPPDVRPEGGVFVGGSWVTQNEGWAADTIFQLSTAESTPDSDWGGLGYAMKRVEQTREYDIKSLGVTAQVATVVYGDGAGGEFRHTIAYFVYDNISYSISFSVPVQERMEMPDADPVVARYPKEAELVDWICGKLETLHY